jgi:hypothetical protein
MIRLRANRGQVANFAKIRRNSIPGPALQSLPLPSSICAALHWYSVFLSGGADRMLSHGGSVAHARRDKSSQAKKKRFSSTGIRACVSLRRPFSLLVLGPIEQRDTQIDAGRIPEIPFYTVPSSDAHWHMPVWSVSAPRVSKFKIAHCPILGSARTRTFSEHDAPQPFQRVPDGHILRVF